MVTPGSLFDGLLSGLEFSVDYYQININKAISTLTAQQELNFCANGSTQQCAFIIRNPNGTLSRVARLAPRSLAELLCEELEMWRRDRLYEAALAAAAALTESLVTEQE